jgi:DNA-binding protein H-NS
MAFLRSEALTKKFCSCEKKVRRTLKKRQKKYAVAICVKSVLQTRGKTLKRFTCRGKTPRVITKALNKSQI